MDNKAKRSYHTDMPMQSRMQKILPAWLYPYAQLARYDRLLPVWMTLMPALSGLMISGVRDPLHYAYFIFGALLVRGAGCTINDIIDRKIDAKVERTQLRPLASGAIKPSQAILFSAIQLALAGILLFQLPKLAIILGLSSLGLIATYPLMKRVFWLPQLVLGFTYNWGYLMGVATGNAEFPPPIFMIYGAFILWTIGFDTIYAHQDIKDDLKLGLKSTAILFGEKSRLIISLIYGASAALFLSAAYMLDFSKITLQVFVFVLIHLAWQLAAWQIKNPQSCLTVFRSNRGFSILLFSIFAMEAYLNA